MTIDLEEQYRDQAVNGKYRKLYEYLCGLAESEWSASFAEIEAIIGFKLPPEAHKYQPWWLDSGFGHVRAWLAAGWKTAEVDIDAETARFWRKDSPAARRRTLDEIWPARSVGPWPEGLSLRREDLYRDEI
jgi:hypothetical protein